LTDREGDDYAGAHRIGRRCPVSRTRVLRTDIGGYSLHGRNSFKPGGCLNTSNARLAVKSTSAVIFEPAPRITRYRSLAQLFGSPKISRAKPLLALLSIVLTTMVLGTRAAEADNPKPKDAPVEVVVFDFSKVQITYRIDGSPGPSAIVAGVLHLASQALLSDDGAPVGFTLHTNLSNAFAASSDGAQSYVAVGAADGIPAECQPAACAPPFWTLTFRLVPKGPVPQPSLLFDLTVSTQYDANGTLVNACIQGQEGCEVSVLVP
jgi:hypothetical protein